VVSILAQVIPNMKTLTKVNRSNRINNSNIHNNNNNTSNNSNHKATRRMANLDNMDNSQHQDMYYQFPITHHLYRDKYYQSRVTPNFRMPAVLPEPLVSNSICSSHHCKIFNNHMV
jgi:hypothetical protein